MNLLSIGKFDRRLVSPRSLVLSMNYPCKGNKRDNVNVIYTPWSNLNKTGDMAIGQVGFHREDKVCVFELTEEDSNKICIQVKRGKLIIRSFH